MRGKFALANLIFSFVLHVVDVGLDIYVAIQYSIRGEWWWFSFTLLFIFLPLLVGNFVGCFEPLQALLQVWTSNIDAIRDWKEENWDNHLPCGSNDCRYSCELCEVFREKKEKSVQSTKDLAQRRYIETIAESAPQWCLQSYVMLRQWFFPWYTCLSIMVSLLSLAWSIATLEKAEKFYEWYIEKKNLKNYPMSPLYVTFFAWQLCGLFSRLPALVLFAYAFRSYVFIVLGVHWMVVILVSFVRHRADSNADSNRHLLGLLGYCMCVSYTALFHISGNVSKLVFGEDFLHRRMAIIVYHVLLSLENIVLVSVAVWATPARVSHMENLKKLGLFAVFVGLIAATVFIILYYCYHHPSVGENENEEQQNHLETENQARSLT